MHDVHSTCYQILGGLVDNVVKYTTTTHTPNLLHHRHTVCRAEVLCNGTLVECQLTTSSYTMSHSSCAYTAQVCLLTSLIAAAVAAAAAAMMQIERNLNCGVEDIAAGYRETASGRMQPPTTPQPSNEDSK